MKHVAKALVVARIKENARHKPHGWDKPVRGPWDRKKIKKAEGGPVTDPDILAKLSEPTPVNDPAILAQLNGEKTAPTTQSESFIPAAIADVPSEIGSAATSAYDTAKKGLTPSGQGEQGQLEHLLNTGKGLMAIPEAIASPIAGAARSLIGHPFQSISNAMREGAVKLYGEDKVRKAEEATGITPGGETYEDAKKNVDLAMSALGAKEVPPIASNPSPLKNITAPTTKELFRAADANYKSARNYGVEIHPQAVSDVADSIFGELHTEGYRDYLAPKTYRAVEELKNPPGQNIEIADLEGVRRALNKAAADPAERDAARRAVSSIDQFVSTLDPKDVAVNPHFTQHVAAEAQEARGNYAAAKRAEVIESAEKKAERQANSAGSGTNIDNATRQKIKEVLNNPKKLRGFSDSEKDRMEKIIRGDPVSNVARLLGKFSPSGIVSGALGAGAGFAAHGPMGAVVVPAVGYAAKKYADASTLRALSRLKNQVQLRSPVGKQASINAAARAALAPRANPMLLPGAMATAPQIQTPFSLRALQGPVPAGAQNEQQ